MNCYRVILSLDDSWSWLWGLKIPAKIITFMWLIMKDRLMSNSLRVRRNMSDSAICSRCNCEVESSIHIIRDCVEARNIWRYFINTSCWDLNTPVVSWLKSNLMSMDKAYLDGIPWNIWFAAISFNIWKDRNNEVINAGTYSDAGTCARIAIWARKVFQAFSILNSQSNCKIPKLIVWSPLQVLTKLTRTIT